MHCHYLEVDLDVVNVRLGFVPEQGVHGHDDAGGAEAALGPVRGCHPFLNSMESSSERLKSCINKSLLRKDFTKGT